MLKFPKKHKEFMARVRPLLQESLLLAENDTEPDYHLTNWYGRIQSNCIEVQSLVKKLSEDFIKMQFTRFRKGGVK